MLSRVEHLVQQLNRAREIVGDRRSAWQLGSDLVATRLLRRMGIDRKGRGRTIQLRGGLTLDYRLNSGDLQSVREVFLDECYRLPFEIDVRTFVDLGANIGLATLWFWQTYRPTQIVAVEALPSNAELTRRTLSNNGIRAKIIEAAVGPRDGTCTFAEADGSNLGSVSAQGGMTVPMVSMGTVLAALPAGTVVDVLKMDIEGGEEALLLGGDVDWLERVRSLIVEFHPPAVDRPRLIEFLKSHGYEYIPPNTVFLNNYEAFVRRDSN